MIGALMPSSLAAAIRASLYPRLAWILQGKPEAEKTKLTAMFEQHVRVLADFLQQAFTEQPGGFGVEFFVNLHRLLFPAGVPYPGGGQRRRVG